MTDQTSKQTTDIRPDIKLIVVDVDGTLLNSKHELTPRTEKALRDAMAKGVQIVLATGKTRRSAEKLIEQLGLQNTPGIYVQGLVIHNGDGSVRWQQTIDTALARQILTFGEERGFTMVMYSGTRILVRANNRDTEELTRYHEPLPEAVGPLQNLLNDMPINKLMAVKLGEVKRIKALRWQLQTMINGNGKLVQAALPDMLEILPPNGSKATALRTLLKDMNIPAAHVLAIGDAENDIDMIKLAGVGVAVGNASEETRAAANWVAPTNDEDGVAEAIERFIIGKPEAEIKPAAETVTPPIEPSETQKSMDAAGPNSAEVVSDASSGTGSAGETAE